MPRMAANGEIAGNAPLSADSDARRNGVSMKELVDQKMGTSLPRVDLHISRTGDGELLLTSRQDGVIRMLVPDSASPATAQQR